MAFSNTQDYGSCTHNPEACSHEERQLRMEKPMIRRTSKGYTHDITIVASSKCARCLHPFSRHKTGMLGTECLGREKLGDWWETQTTTKCTCTGYSTAQTGAAK
jgi:hypothetical protein